MADHSYNPSNDELILYALKSVYPKGIGSKTLMDQFGPAAKSRIGFLRNAGWQIRTDQDVDQATYSLMSLHRKESVNDRQVQIGVRVIQRPDGRWDITPYASSIDPIGSERVCEQIKELLNPTPHLMVEDCQGHPSLLEFLGLE